jgi:Pin2-interacting protein X1
MKSHLKVAHKLDMLGIGAAHTKDPNGIAWKQNRDFERLLERLNGGTGEGGGNGTKVDGFARANEEAEAEGVEEKKEEGTRDEKAEKRARKEAKREKRKLKEEGKEEKKSKKRKMEVMVEESVVEEVIIAPVASTSKVPPRG